MPCRHRQVCRWTDFLPVLEIVRGAAPLTGTLSVFASRCRCCACTVHIVGWRAFREPKAFSSAPGMDVPGPVLATWWWRTRHGLLGRASMASLSGGVAVASLGRLCPRPSCSLARYASSAVACARACCTLRFRLLCGSPVKASPLLSHRCRLDLGLPHVGSI